MTVAVLFAWVIMASPLLSLGFLYGGVPSLRAGQFNTTPMSQAWFAHSVSENTSHNVSQNMTMHLTGFNPNQPAKVGKVTALYFSPRTENYAQTISTSGYSAANPDGDVFYGDFSLPKPSCPLQMTTQFNYKTENRKVNLRLAAIAVCDYLHGYTMHDLPSCGAGSNEVCELMLDVPITNGDEYQEPYLGAAMALAAYSKICSLLSGMHDYNCRVHRSNSAVLAGLQRNSKNGTIHLSGYEVAGLLNMRLYEAYEMYFEHVFLAQQSVKTYEETEFHRRMHDFQHWQHFPPTIVWCDTLACLIDHFINHQS